MYYNTISYTVSIPHGTSKSLKKQINNSLITRELEYTNIVKIEQNNRRPIIKKNYPYIDTTIKY